MKRMWARIDHEVERIGILAVVGLIALGIGVLYLVSQYQLVPWINH